MKKSIALVLVLLLALSAVSCGGASEIPSLEEIRAAHRYSDDRLERMLQRVKRDELIKTWGEPDRRVEEENEDVWVLDGARVLVISYTLGGRVDDADIEP